jgi:hypothetical protein
MKAKQCISCGKLRKSVKKRKVFKIDDDKPKGYYSIQKLYCFTCHKNLPKYNDGVVY